MIPTMKRVPLTLFCTLILAAAAADLRAEPRTWTSAADPTKTFEAELVAVSATEITASTMKLPLRTWARCPTPPARIE